MNNVSQIFVGVDVSKKHLDAHLYPINKDLKIDNSDKGIQELIEFLSNFNIAKIVVEPTGSYERNLVTYCKNNKYDVLLINPKRIRAFIISEGVNAKTDKIDARMIALFGASKTRPPAVEIPGDDVLKPLIRRRADFIAMISDEKKRLDYPSQAACKEMIENHIAFMEQQVLALDEKIQKRINQNDDMKEKLNIRGWHS